MSDLSVLEKAIGYTFGNQRLLAEAMTHPSNKGNSKGVADNTFLQLLGNEAIRFIVTKEVVARKLGVPGVISRIRDNVHNKGLMLELAVSFNLKDHLRVSEGMRGSLSLGLLAGFEGALVSAVEALVGAIFTDGGYDALENFGKKFLFPKISETRVKDPKTLLQEAIQARGGVSPTYRILETEGHDHNQTFVVGVYTGNYLLARGEGSNRKEAEKVAAQRALQNIMRKSN